MNQCNFYNLLHIINMFYKDKQLSMVNSHLHLKDSCIYQQHIRCIWQYHQCTYHKIDDKNHNYYLKNSGMIYLDMFNYKNNQNRITVDWQLINMINIYLLLYQNMSCNQNNMLYMIWLLNLHKNLQDMKFSIMQEFQLKMILSYTMSRILNLYRQHKQIDIIYRFLFVHQHNSYLGNIDYMNFKIGKQYYNQDNYLSKPQNMQDNQYHIVYMFLLKQLVAHNIPVQNVQSLHLQQEILQLIEFQILEQKSNINQISYPQAVQNKLTISLQAAQLDIQDAHIVPVLQDPVGQAIQQPLLQNKYPKSQVLQLPIPIDVQEVHPYEQVSHLIFTLSTKVAAGQVAIQFPRQFNFPPEQIIQSDYAEPVHVLHPGSHYLHALADNAPKYPSGHQATQLLIAFIAFKKKPSSQYWQLNGLMHFKQPLMQFSQLNVSALPQNLSGHNTNNKLILHMINNYFPMDHHMLNMKDCMLSIPYQDLHSNQIDIELDISFTKRNKKWHIQYIFKLKLMYMMYNQQHINHIYLDSYWLQNYQNVFNFFNEYKQFSFYKLNFTQFIKAQILYITYIFSTTCQTSFVEQVSSN